MKRATEFEGQELGREGNGERETELQLDTEAEGMEEDTRLVITLQSVS